MGDTSSETPRGEAKQPPVPALSRPSGTSPGPPPWWPGLSQPPQGDDRPEATRAGSPLSTRRRRLFRLFGVGVAALSCGIAVAVVLDSSGRTDTAQESGTTSGQVFTDVSDGCSLTRPATIDSYAPGAVCTPSPFDRPSVPGLTTRMPEWRTDTSSANGRVSIGVDLSVGSGVLDTYSSEKDSTAHMFAMVRDTYRANKSNAADMYDGDLLTLKASYPLKGIGEEAHFFYGVSTASERAVAELVARSGNAEFSVAYSGTREGPGSSGKPVPRREAEAALTAVAHDVLKSLR